MKTTVELQLQIREAENARHERIMKAKQEYVEACKKAEAIWDADTDVLLARYGKIESDACQELEETCDPALALEREAKREEQFAIHDQCRHQDPDAARCILFKKLKEIHEEYGAKDPAWCKYYSIVGPAFAEFEDKNEKAWNVRDETERLALENFKLAIYVARVVCEAAMAMI